MKFWMIELEYRLLNTHELRELSVDASYTSRWAAFPPISDERKQALYKSRSRFCKRRC
jgi:hypothetical protein